MNTLYIFNQPGVQSSRETHEVYLKRLPAVTEEPPAFILRTHRREEEINIVVRRILFLVCFLIKIWLRDCGFNPSWGTKGPVCSVAKTEKTWGDFCGQIQIYLATRASLSYSFFKHFSCESDFHCLDSSVCPCLPQCHM